MTRIVAGAARGRRLKVPPGERTRPTSDRVREALFSSLESRLGSLVGLRVLDLYAGSGALGLEALSRGAALALLVESDTTAVRAIRANVDALGFPGAVVQAASVERTLAQPPAEPFDLIMADPPYTMSGDDLTSALAALTHGWLTSEALIVVERPRRGEPVVWPTGLVCERKRRYGETMLWYGRPTV